MIFRFTKNARIVLLAALMGCTTTSEPTAKVVRKDLIPAGTYEQKINLTVFQKNEERHFSFRGVLKIEKESILVLALSPFGTTEFKLEDDGKEIRAEIYREALQKAKERITDYYLVLKSLLRAKQSKTDETLLTWEKENALGLPTQLKKSDTVFKIKRYDEKSVPVEIVIANKDINVNVRVISYEEN